VASPVYFSYLRFAGIPPYAIAVDVEMPGHFNLTMLLNGYLPDQDISRDGIKVIVLLPPQAPAA
jgi:hypothetical protein